MNWNEIEGKWSQFKGDIKTKWSKLTDDDLKKIDGKKDILIGKIQEKYGKSKDEAEKEVSSYLNE